MKTIGELKDKLRTFTCNEDSDIFSDDDLQCYIEMAQRKATSIISTLNTDNLISCEDQAVLAGSTTAELPADIQGTRIKKVYWIGSDGKCCALERLGYDCEFDDCASNSGPFGYQYFNKSSGAKLYLQLPPKEDGTIRIIYYRTQSLESDDDTTELDVSTCDFIFYFVKKMIREKEKSPLVNLAIAEMNEAEQMMKQELSNGFEDDKSCELETDSCWEDYVTYNPNNYSRYSSEI